MKNISLLLLLSILITSSVSAAAAESTTASQPAPTVNTMPQIPDIVKLINKASTSQDQKAAEWSTPVKLVMIFSLLAVLPSLLAMMTSFTRIAVVLGFVRRALGTQNIPPNTVLLGLALFLTLFTMTPTMIRMNTEAIQPYLAGQIDVEAASAICSNIIKDFMLRQTRTSDLKLFVNMAKIQPPQNPTELGLQIITPAFIISEFRTSFEIGCLLFIPFLLLDLVIASVLLSAGMMMLPPVMISMPLKLILFILVDGWGILAQGLSLSFR
jgi:flagellar biosynthesis protein FliP